MHALGTTNPLLIGLAGVMVMTRLVMDTSWYPEESLLGQAINNCMLELITEKSLVG